MPDSPQTERNTGLAVQLGLQLNQRQIGFRCHPIHHLTLRLGARPPLTPWLVRHALGLPSAVPLCGNLFRPAQAHQEAIRKLLQRLLALIVGQQKLTAQVIPIWLRHRFTRRRVSPNIVYTIKETALNDSIYFTFSPGALDWLISKSLRPSFAFTEPPSITRIEEPGLPCSFASTCVADQTPSTCRSP